MKNKLVILTLTLLLLAGGIVYANKNLSKHTHSAIKQTKKTTASSGDYSFVPFIGFE